MRSRVLAGTSLALGGLPDGVSALPRLLLALNGLCLLGPAVEALNGLCVPWWE